MAYEIWKQQSTWINIFCDVRELLKLYSPNFNRAFEDRNEEIKMCRSTNILK